MFNKIIYDQESGVASYINSIDDLNRIEVTAHAANEKIGSFNRIEEYKIIVAASEYEEGIYRCSIRSKEKSVVEVVEKYGGGGHKFASGARVSSMEEAKMLLSDLDDACREFIEREGKQYEV